MSSVDRILFPLFTTGHELVAVIIVYKVGAGTLCSATACVYYLSLNRFNISWSVWSTTFPVSPTLLQPNPDIMAANPPFWSLTSFSFGVISNGAVNGSLWIGGWYAVGWRIVYTMTVQITPNKIQTGTCYKVWLYHSLFIRSAGIAGLR